MEFEDFLERPRNWNGFYYTVIHGLRPGIYWDWDSCLRAVGYENYDEGRGKWRKLANLEQSLQELQNARVVQGGNDRAEWRENARPPVVINIQHNQQLLQQALEAAMEELAGLREERERCTQLMEQIRGQLDRALEQITRLETASQQQQTAQN